MPTQKFFNLSGKKALVTGCSRGIGEAITIALAEAGADIVGVFESVMADSRVEKEVTALGRNFSSYKIDLSNRQEIYNTLKHIDDAGHQIDILINNAGIIRRNPAVAHSDEDWDAVLSINLDAPFILARELGKKMISRGYGKIVFTCSLLSFQGGINVPGYTASKSALGGLVKALANEWASHGVNVNGIAPGYIATDNTEALRNDAARSKAILDRIPAGRWGEAIDLAGPVLFLCAPASDYVNGEILTVDGGWMGR